MTEREKIAKLIEKLRAMTTENGCTENEASIALMQLEKLMEQYNMTFNEQETLNADYMKLDITAEDGGKLLVHNCLGIVAKYTNTRAWFSRGYAYTILGEKVDVLNAEYVLRLLDSSLRYELKQFIKDRNNYKYQHGFILGFCYRIQERLQKIIDDRNANQPQTYGIVLTTKKNMIRKYMDELGVQLRHKTRHLTVSGGFHEGYASGDNVQINKGVSQNLFKNKQLR